MELPHVIGYGLLGVALGALGTLIGAGGGFLLIPILLFLHPGDSVAGRVVSPSSRTRTLVEKDGTVHVYAPRIVLGAALSTGVGFLSSLLGIGGGILHVPAMVYLLGFPVHVATATSHFVLAFLALAGVLVHATQGDLAPGYARALPLSAGVVAGAPIGAWLSNRIQGRWILRGLALALASVGLRLLIAR